MAMVCGSPRVKVPGSRPKRFIIPIIRMDEAAVAAEAAVALDFTHMMMATATPTMIMSRMICVVTMV